MADRTDTASRTQGGGSGLRPAGVRSYRLPAMPQEPTEPPRTVGDLIEVLRRFDPNEPIRAAEDRITGMSRHCKWVVGVWHLPPEEEFLAIVFADGSGSGSGSGSH